ncbi:segment polarity protein dishevelled homolog DVL-3-like isoform X1 [Bolinopsis microptera]|uniref:segment polarity protein dishevelled homolog DVL-3-like isoform X1 n=1 Tax=Bolinopsis microptera TaxID=2820187 RepID=UPI00307AD284
MTETKIVYHIGDEDTPYLVCIPIPPEEITLGDFTKEIDKQTGYRYYFKTLDEDLIVKQELKNPAAILPCYHSRVVAWITPDVTTNGKGSGGLVNGSPNTDQPVRSNQSGYNDDSDASSIFSDTSSVMSSEIESTSESVSVVDSDEERSRESRQRQRRRKRKKQTMKPPMRCGSLSSMTESSSSLNIITVTLDMEACSFLGFSIYSNSDDSAMPGIYVGQIYKGGAVEADGRISPNDLILNVNEISFENIGNGDAARILQEIAQKPGPIKLVVAKTNRDSMVDLHESDFTDADTVSIASSHTTFSYTLDPTAQWIQQQQKGAGNFGFNFNEGSYYPTSYSLYSTTGSESPANSQIGGDTIRGQQQPAQPLTVYSKMEDVAHTMAQPTSGLEIKERTWLKVTIPDAFIGQDLVKWLKEHISGLSDHKEARRFASNMLKNGYIQNTVNKSEKFSDQCYYICGDGSKMKTASADRLQTDMQGLSIEPTQSHRSYNSWAGKAQSVRSQGSAGTMSSSSPRSAPRGMVAPRPGPGSSGSGPPSYRTTQHGQKGVAPPPSYHSYTSGKPSSQMSGFAPHVQMPPQPAPGAPPAGPLSRTDSIASLASVYSQHSMMGRPLGSMPASVASSQASFRMAMDNSMEYYSDAV